MAASDPGTQVVRGTPARPQMRTDGHLAETLLGWQRRVFRILTWQGVRRWCEERVPAHVRDQVRVECDVAARHLAIVECRPPWREEMGSEWTRFPIARLRYTKSPQMWSLYWRDRNLRFHEYDLVPPTSRVDDVLEEIDRDPTAIFWARESVLCHEMTRAATCVHQARHGRTLRVTRLGS